MTRGVVYYAVRRPKYVGMAALSAKSLRRYMPDTSITLFTDLPDCQQSKKPVFDSVESLPAVSELLCHNISVAIANSPYDLTLFLGADTWICGDLSEIFDVLEYSPLDLMLPLIQQYRYVHRLDSIFEEAGVPDAYPRYETGVIGIKRNHKTEILIAQWTSEYEKLCEKWALNQICSDQVPLRIALHQLSDIQIGVLPSCYDYQLYGFFNRPIKAMHVKGPEEQLVAWEREANKHSGLPRYFEAGKCIRRLRQ